MCPSVPPPPLQPPGQPGGSSAPPPNEQKLVRDALAHVQAILRGNGVKKENITIISHKIAHHTMNAGTYLELKPVVSERSTPGKTVAGQLLGSRDDARRAVDQAMATAARDATGKAQIANTLLQRPDQGFGMNRQAVPLNFLAKEYSWHEACQTCRGTAQAPCQRCLGKRIEPCIKCTGRGLMFCPMCRGTGLLQGNKCPRCHAQRYVPCDGCRQSGMMNCRMCQATGVMKCQTCNGLGWKTHILSVSAQALTYFEYDGKSIPKPAADMIETRAEALATSGKIKITGRVADEKENVLGANYEVGFPFGEILFQIGKKEVKAYIFGNEGDLVEFPFVLDRMLAGAVQELSEAANDVGSVADKIRDATRYRLIAQAYLASLRMPSKKAVASLLKTYDIGLSPGMAERIVMLADQTESRITRKPRYYGLIAGLLVTAGINAAYYLLPVRAMAAGMLPDQRFDVVLDLPLPIIGGLVTAMAIKLFAASAIKKALGHLASPDKKGSLGAKTHTSGMWAYAGATIVTFVLMEVSAQMHSDSPYWYEMLRSMLQRITGF